jgi:MoxR-like ATPase
VNADPVRIVGEDKDVELLGRLAAARDRLLEQIGRRIVGQHEVLQGVLTAIVSGGHALLLGVPGLGKTLMVSTIADALALKFSRIQFTPDLMPSDITGTEIIQEDLSTGRRGFRFVHGLATQNPIEQEGTYPLPEAQLDRFMLEIAVQYPDRDEEERIVETTTGDDEHPVEAVLDDAELVEIQHLVRRIPAPKPVVRAAVKLARTTRPDEDAPETIRQYVSWGAGPRASQFLVLGAKAQAALDGRPMADLDDIRTVALSVLRHRLVVNFAAEAAGRSAEDICKELVEGEEWMR